MTASAPPSSQPVAAKAVRQRVTFWGAVAAILRKDLKAEFRTKEVFNSSAVFALLVIVIFSMAFEPTSAVARSLSGGLLWVAFTFSAMLALSRTFAREVPNDCLLGLQMAPVTPSAIYVGKLVSNLLFLGLLELLLLPLFSLFYNVRLLDHAWQMGEIILLGSWGLAAVGTTFAAIATTVRLRELMLPVLLFPIEIPLILSLVEATTAVLQGTDPIVETRMWLRICLGFDVIFTILSLYLFAYILEE
ncbi:MAG: heme exporter protein CcmB [Acidobacteria bacterium]|nr:heme exporter protein CcmB [Acidobacteriota bacterium]